jgi:hypothetical protein
LNPLLLNESPETSSRRWFRLTFIAIVLATLIVAGVGYWQRRQYAATLLTLPEALWVTERDYSRYYAPGSPESRGVVEALALQDASFLERRFDSLVLYRRGLSDSDFAREPLLVFGFDPSSIPRDKVVPAR